MLVEAVMYTRLVGIDHVEAGPIVVGKAILGHTSILRL